MQPEFWHDRWDRNQIGFHLQQVNPYLQRLWPTLGLAQGARVLVPLCGKSLDMSWLAANGFEVLGVELTQTAVEQFFSEQQVALHRPRASSVAGRPRGTIRCSRALPEPTRAHWAGCHACYWDWPGGSGCCWRRCCPAGFAPGHRGE